MAITDIDKPRRCPQVSRLSHASSEPKSLTFCDGALVPRRPMTTLPATTSMTAANRTLPSVATITASIERPVTDLPASVPVSVKQSRMKPIPALAAAQQMVIDFSRRDVVRPFGSPRYVNAETLRAMAGAHFGDKLMRKVRGIWEFVAENTTIDLTDSTQHFRLGRLTILS